MQLERKGKWPDLSRLTKANVLKVGARAMKAHLDRVTGTLAKKHTAPGAGTLGRITGRGIARLQDTTVTERAGDIQGIVPLNKYMKVHEFGMVIRAKGKGYLTVPLPAALNADGTPKKGSALLWRKAQVIKSKRGNLLIAVRNGPNWIPLYVLKESVKLAARLGLRDELKKDRKNLWRDVRAGIRSLIRGND